MSSPSPFQRLLRTRLASFVMTLALHLGWALCLGIALIALRRAPSAPPPAPGEATFLPALVLVAAACAAGAAVVWSWRQQVVRWIRGLSRDDLTAGLAATCTAAISLTLVGLVATGLPGLAQRLSPGEMSAVVCVALALIGTLACGFGWILVEGLVGVTSTLPGRAETSFTSRNPD